MSGITKAIKMLTQDAEKCKDGHNWKFQRVFGAFRISECSKCKSVLHEPLNPVNGVQ